MTQVFEQIKVNFTLEYATEAQRVHLYSFCNLGAIWGWVVNATPRPLYSRERGPVSIVGGMGPRADLDGCKISPPPPHWNSIQDSTTRRESLYRLSYTAHCNKRYTRFTILYNFVF